ncbi:MAG TPA: N-acetyltransferase family protein [Anaerolineae bacterium]|nr:N-acetyltransferase family protein [Anaerolineae bacterium]
MATTLTIAPLQESHWPVVRAIFEEGLATGLATFETQTPIWEAWDQAHRPDCRLVAQLEEQVVGWAALSPVSRRQVYHGVAEVSIYLAARVRGQGFGKTLLLTLIAESERAGIWTLQATIFPHNHASIAMHEACGFRRVGVRERIAQRHGVWLDTTLLERRSPVVGG